MKVLKNARLIDGTGRGAVKDATIVIDGERIAAIGTQNQSDFPANAEVIDCAGMTGAAGADRLPRPHGQPPLRPGASLAHRRAAKHPPSAHRRGAAPDPGGVNHLAGHLAAAALEDPTLPSPPAFPHLALLVSGGHTAIHPRGRAGQDAAFGATRDDAAGEAFDKVGKMLGLGYPGGNGDRSAGGDRRCASGDAAARAARARRSRFQLLGPQDRGVDPGSCQTWRRWIHGPARGRAELADFCASFQTAVVDVLVRKSRRALAREGLRDLVVCGGVAANRGLRGDADGGGAQRRFRALHSAAQTLHRQRLDDRRRGKDLYWRGTHAGRSGRSIGPGLPL